MSVPVELTGPQEAAVRRLVDDHVLSAEQADAVRAALSAAVPGRPGPARWLVELAGYVGGGLMLGGVALLLGASWDELTRTGRSALLAGFAVAFAIAGILVAGGPVRVRRLSDSPARRRIVSVLFAMASVPAAFAMGVAVDRYSGFSGAVVGLAVAVAGLAVLPAAPGVVAAAAMSIVATAEAVDRILHLSPLGTGLVVAGLGLVWLGITLLRVIPARPLGATIGTGIALFGAQQPLGTDDDHAWGYLLTFALAVGFVVLYRWQRTLVLLVAGIVGVTLAVPEAVADWTGGSLHGSVILLVAGAVLVAASAVGLRIRQHGSGGAAGGSAYRT
jgi:hypothetical protein